MSFPRLTEGVLEEGHEFEKKNSPGFLDLGGAQGQEGQPLSRGLSLGDMLRITAAVACLGVARSEVEECRSLPPPHKKPMPNRVALVLRGETFRGLNFDFHFSRDAADRRTDNLRRRLPCLNSSYALQRALAKNHVEQIVEPLERRGLAVDVFLASYGCWSLVADANDPSGGFRAGLQD